ncbi:MAG: hypothetical protein KC496_21310, partial [Anaerolineae bacterium]|nr:hypothetical protein [Anaerolineae bacterium]
MVTEDVRPQQDNLPEKPKKGSNGRLVVWLVAMSMAMLFLPLFLMASTLQEDVLAMETEYAQLSEALSLTPTPDVAAEDIRVTLLQLQSDAVLLTSTYDELANAGLDWFAVMDSLLQYDQEAILLTRIMQEENGLLVEGTATNENAILRYVNTLREADPFSGVQV